MCEQAVHVKYSSVRWRVRASWQERVLGGTAPNWFALQDDSRAVHVKTGHQRSTWRVTCKDRTVFAKVVDAAETLGTLAWFKQLAIGTAAEREWRACLEAERRGVSVVRAVAIGVRTRSSLRTVFLSEALPDAQPLSDIWKSRVTDLPLRERRRAAIGLIEVVARLFAVSHERGFVHGDAHPDNVLAFTGKEGIQEVAFVDVHSARMTKRPASLQSALVALAHFDQYLQRHASRTERLRFLRRYWSQRPSLAAVDSHGPGAVGRDLLSDLAGAKVLHASRLALQRDRRLRRKGKYFSTLALPGGWQATVVQELERRHMFPEPHVADRTESDWRKILKPMVARVDDKESTSDFVDHERCHVEVERLANLTERLAATLRGSRHRQLFERCHKERHRDKPSPLILAFVEHRSAGLIDTTLLVRVGK